MNAPAKLAPDNLGIWNALARTDPRHTKGFKRAGGFTGTAIKPIWIVQRLTEQFGPVGVGWGMGHPRFEVVQGHNGEVLVYCTVECWHSSPDNTFIGVGGDKVITHIKANQQYNRPERWENDDEAFKKAFTDAVGNAFKFVGVGADVHMGLFDDSKYVRDTEREFAATGAASAGGQSKAQGEPPADPNSTPPAKGWREPDSQYSTPSKLAAALRNFEREVEGCGDSDMVYGLTSTDDWKEFVRIAEKHAPHYLRGGEPAPPEFEGLIVKAERKVREFDSATANNMAELART